MSTVTATVANDICLVTLNRPEALNAFSTEMMDDLCEAFLATILRVRNTGSSQPECEPPWPVHRFSYLHLERWQESCAILFVGT